MEKTCLAMRLNDLLKEFVLYIILSKHLVGNVESLEWIYCVPNPYHIYVYSLHTYAISSRKETCDLISLSSIPMAIFHNFSKHLGLKSVVVSHHHSHIYIQDPNMIDSTTFFRNQNFSEPKY